MPNLREPSGITSEDELFALLESDRTPAKRNPQTIDGTHLIRLNKDRLAQPSEHHNSAIRPIDWPSNLQNLAWRLDPDYTWWIVRDSNNDICLIAIEPA